MATTSPGGGRSCRRSLGQRRALAWPCSGSRGLAWQFTVLGRYRTGYAPASPLLRPDRKAEGMARSAEVTIRRLCSSQSATRLQPITSSAHRLASFSVGQLMLAASWAIPNDRGEGLPLTDPLRAINQYREVAMKQTTEHHASTTALPIYVHRFAERRRASPSNSWGALQRASQIPVPDVPMDLCVRITGRAPHELSRTSLVSSTNCLPVISCGCAQKKSLMRRTSARQPCVADSGQTASITKAFSIRTGATAVR